MTAAGFYHCSVKSVGRANGRSIVAAAAYRSGQRLEDERTGEIFDYRARGGVLDGFIIACLAPDWTHDREQLWSKAELAEQRANGRLATELELALPHELSPEQRKELVTEFVRGIVERHGTAADVAIHAAGKAGDHRNIHAHVLFTHRKLNVDGFVGKVKGQRKDPGLSSFAMGGDAVTEIRKEWEQHVNRAYERAGLDIRVDHRSHKERGIQQEPTKHLGPAASAMERRGDGSDRGDINRQIEADNAAALRERAAREIAAVKAAADLAAAEQLAQMERAAAAPITDDDDSRRRKTMAIERDDATDPKIQQKQIEDQQDLASRAKEQTELSERFLASVKRAQEEGEKLREAEQQAAQKAAQDDDIADARGRYAQAAGERYDIRRPYSSLAEVVGHEGAMLRREQEKLKREAALERDPDKRELIELRRQIEANDYMAITSDRLAAMSRVITGNSNSEESQRQAQRAEHFAAEALDLRQQRQEVQERIEQREREREAQRIDQHLEVARRWQARHGGNAAAGQTNQSASEPLQEAAPGHDEARAVSAPGQPERPISEAERPAEVIYFGPSRPEPEAQPATGEITDARQAESASADNIEITDSKAAKKAALAQMRVDTEQSIAQGQERGHGHSR